MLLSYLLRWDESRGHCCWGHSWRLVDGGLVHGGCCEKLLFVEEAEQLLLLRDDVLHQRRHELGLLLVRLVLNDGLTQWNLL